MGQWRETLTKEIVEKSLTVRKGEKEGPFMHVLQILNLWVGCHGERLVDDLIFGSTVWRHFHIFLSFEVSLKLRKQ